ncbi:MAG: CRISPR-associated endonuclease Cas2 [Patescibacteria group bacterium]
MKGEFTLKILEKLSEAAIGMADLLEAIHSSGYGASVNKINYTLRKIQRQRRKNSEETEKDIRLQKRYYNILDWLRRDGLIAERLEGNRKVFYLTRLGYQKLSLLHKRMANALPAPRYEAAEHKGFVIATFDVPEKEKRKREWIRAALKNMGFKMLQKSVWIGKIKVPQNFIDDLSRLRLIDFVEIFEITKTGSIRSIA